jgi:hypothetical protein
MILKSLIRLEITLYTEKVFCLAKVFFIVLTQSLGIFIIAVAIIHSGKRFK